MTSNPVARLSQSQAAKLLNTLCVKYGFCLPPLWNARLERNPPTTAKAFTDTVFYSEGLDPVIADSNLYAALHQEVVQSISSCGHRVVAQLSTSEQPMPNYSFKRTAATGCSTIMRRSAAAA